MKKIKKAFLAAVVSLSLTTVAYADAALDISPIVLLSYVKHSPVEFLVIVVLLAIFCVLWWIGQKKD